MKHGFIKIGTASPTVSVADCEKNLNEILKIHHAAKMVGVHLMVYPELCLTGCTCADLFYADALLDSAKKHLELFLEATKDSPVISILGLPLLVNDKLYNSSVICQNGKILGAVPKSAVQNETDAPNVRIFASGPDSVTELFLCGQVVPFGAGLIFCSLELPAFRFAVEIGSDLYAPVPPSSLLASSGALLIAHPTAIAQTVGATDFHRLMVQSQSARALCAYASVSCGEGESTTDLVFSGHCLIAENGTLLSERAPFDPSSSWQYTEVDLLHLSTERQKRGILEDVPASFHFIPFHSSVTETPLSRFVDPHPFVPSDTDLCRQRCDSILTVQAQGLAQRMTRAYAKTAVIGISGGLDSCLAMLVAARAMELLDRPYTDILGVTMPCFGTTNRTKTNAEILCNQLGARFRSIPITDAVKQHFSDIGQEETDHNVVYENAQARERTQVLMDLANMENGLVVGTGDLSELALGWATYNGDHMSMYGVNAGVPKTLIRHVVATCAHHAEEEGRLALGQVLRDILDTPVSPELLPADAQGKIAQKTEDLVGPYELHDFYLYHMIRWHESPDKTYRLAKIAFGDTYSDQELWKWLRNFVRRFFAQQFKRSCLPDGPKIGSVSFSPRGDWHMPSDASAKTWLDAVDALYNF